MFSSVNLYQKKNPFSTHWGQMYIQKDSIAMGWPFSVIFKNFYISTIKERVFCHNQKLPTYVRYTDDTFVKTNNNREVE